MKKATRALGLVAAGLWLTACSGAGDDPPPFAGEAADLTAKLETATGARWRADRDGQGTAVLYFSAGEGRPVLANAKRSPNDILAFLAPFHNDLGASPDLSREFEPGEAVVEATSEEAGTYRFKQHVPGTAVPVFDGQLVVAVTEEGALQYVSTTYARGLERVSTVPALDAKSAADRARTELGAGFSMGAPTLGVSARDLAHPSSPTASWPPRRRT